MVVVGYLVGCFTPVLTDLVRVYSQNLGGLGAALAIFAKSPRLGLDPKRGV
jgi:hypothetical protein